MIEQGSATSKVRAGRKAAGSARLRARLDDPYGLINFRQIFRTGRNCRSTRFALRGTVKNSGARRYCASIKP
jgi:hypothetical protein